MEEHGGGSGGRGRWEGRKIEMGVEEEGGGRRGRKKMEVGVEEKGYGSNQ